MEPLFAAVIAAALSPVWTPATEVKLEQLPPECAAVYEPYLKKLRKADSTEVICSDLDQDGKKEMLVWDGSSGSGGQGWHIMMQQGEIWRTLDKIFGDVMLIPHADRTGLLVGMPSGWDEAFFEYYELRHGKMQKILSFGIEYSVPVRKNPVKISIQYTEYFQ